MKSRDSQMSILYSLAESLKARYLDNEEEFIKTYGEEIHNKFYGMAPIINSFLKEHHDICKRLNHDRYKRASK